MCITVSLNICPCYAGVSPLVCECNLLLLTAQRPEAAEEKKPLKKRIKELKVLDPKMAQNLSIFLGSFRIPYEEIRRMIVEVDEEQLTESMIQNLLKNLPEEEQLMALVTYQPEYSSLSEPEQFGVVTPSCSPPPPPDPILCSSWSSRPHPVVLLHHLRTPSCAPPGPPDPILCSSSTTSRPHPVVLHHLQTPSCAPPPPPPDPILCSSSTTSRPHPVVLLVLQTPSCAPPGPPDPILCSSWSSRPHPMSGVKRLRPRLAHLLFCLQFEEQVSILRPQMAAVGAACEEVRRSRSFGRLLELVLLLGNYMNTGSRNARSHGFHLGSLCKLKDTRSADQSTTLLHFLAQVCEEEEFGEVVKFVEELQHVDRASRVSAETLQKSLVQMERQLLHLEKDLETFSSDDPQDMFLTKIVILDLWGHMFSQNARQQYDKLQAMHRTMETQYQNLLCFFSMDPKNTSLEELFTDLSNFRSMFT
ncbi:hypothetical protein NHX12_006201, partial [Muraenolepis orangiensis]